MRYKVAHIADVQMILAVMRMAIQSQEVAAHPGILSLQGPKEGLGCLLINLHLVGDLEEGRVLPAGRREYIKICITVC